MAKKNLASLMSGIMGEPSESMETQPQDSSNRNNGALASETEQPAKPKRGRPRKAQAGSESKEIRATFIVDSEMVRKMKYISLVEGRMLKDVMSDALSSFIEKWENRNGEINLPKVD